jgi:2-polyprenyl-6-methoxyphenol hydroxylase-like FAD-dependent oxidoreductase
MAESSQPRVLIAGAGPTGLCLALCLRAFGLDCDLWDPKPGPQDSSKALSINPASAIQLDLLGIGGALGVHSRRVRRLEVRLDGARRLNAVDLRWLDCERDYFQIQSQFQTERELLATLQARGGAVAWNTRLLSLTRDGDTFTASGRRGEQTFAREYDYVIGCDGKRSVVREFIGATMSGGAYDMYLALGDFDLDWDVSPEMVHYHVHADTFFVFVPLPEPRRWRVVVKHAGTPAAADDALLTEPVRRHLGRDIFASASHWRSVAPLYVQTASHLGEDRVFIAGDAAHLYSPIGGTGMNTGMQDAINLGWKLAFALRGWDAGGDLLASYQRERLPVILANAAATDAMTQAISMAATDPKAYAPFLPGFAKRALLRDVFPQSFSGLSMRYGPAEDASGLGRFHHALVRLVPHLGHFLGLQVFAFADDADGLAAGSALVSACRALQGVRCHVLVPEGLSMLPEQALVLPRAQWQALRAVAGSLQLVRPDGFIDHAGALSQWSVLVQALRGRLRAVAPATAGAQRDSNTALLQSSATV